MNPWSKPKYTQSKLSLNDIKVLKSKAEKFKPSFRLSSKLENHNYAKLNNHLYNDELIKLEFPKNINNQIINSNIEKILKETGSILIDKKGSVIVLYRKHPEGKSYLD